MKRKVTFCLAMVLSVSLWAAGVRHGSALVDISAGWHGSLQFDTLFDSHRVATVGSVTTEGMGDFLEAMDVSEGVKLKMMEGISSVALGVGVRQMHWEKLGWNYRVSFLIPCKTSYTFDASSGENSAREKFSFGLDDFQFFGGWTAYLGWCICPSEPIAGI